MKRFALVKNGFYESFTTGPDTSRPPLGYIEIPFDVDYEALRGTKFDPQQPGVPGEKEPEPAVRLLPLDRFMDRIPVDEEVALRVLAASDKLDPADKVKAAVYMGRLFARQTVNLDADTLIDALAFFRRIGVPDVWPDEQTADARIAAIRA